MRTPELLKKIIGNEEFEGYTEEDDPFKGECRSCGASLEDCRCWDHYKD